jgi:hypothetical protein
MPTLKDLLAELREMGVLPSEIKVSRKIVSELTSKAEEIVEENPQPEET